MHPEALGLPGAEGIWSVSEPSKSHSLTVLIEPSFDGSDPD
jgi:hypothetical protein